MNILKTIKEIGKKKAVVIRLADKGGGLVILKKNNYEKEMENLLKVENTYKKLKGNPKLRYEKKLKAFVKRERQRNIKQERSWISPIGIYEEPCDILCAKGP